MKMIPMNALKAGDILIQRNAEGKDIEVPVIGAGTYKGDGFQLTYRAPDGKEKTTFFGKQNASREIPVKG